MSFFSLHFKYFSLYVYPGTTVGKLATLFDQVWHEGKWQDQLIQRETVDG